VLSQFLEVDVVLMDRGGEADGVGGGGVGVSVMAEGVDE
jgi:hypothetical protein